MLFDKRRGERSRQRDDSQLLQPDFIRLDTGYSLFVVKVEFYSWSPDEKSYRLILPELDLRRSSRFHGEQESYFIRQLCKYFDVDEQLSKTFTVYFFVFSFCRNISENIRIRRSNFLKMLLH